MPQFDGQSKVKYMGLVLVLDGSFKPRCKERKICHLSINGTGLSCTACTYARSAPQAELDCQPQANNPSQGGVR